MANKEYKFMTPEMREHFLKYGWVRIEGGVAPEDLDHFSHDVWVRLGYDLNDKSTWEREKIHLPRHREIATKEYMPKVYGVIAELLGGEDNIHPELFTSCGDSLICNLGSKEWEDKEPLDPRLLGNWHIDGDWFRHFLDSGDQALTSIVFYNDIEPKAGGTFVAPDGIKHVVKWLFDHPEGADTWPQDETGARTVCNAKELNEFIECTGKAGDVILFHAFMPHSASKNYRRIPRFITNPTITSKDPQKLSRQNPDDYTLIELVTRRALKESGVTEEEIAAWKPTRPRKRFTPRTRAGKDAMINAELERMLAQEVASEGEYKVESMHRNGPVQYLVVPEIEGY